MIYVIERPKKPTSMFTYLFTDINWSVSHKAVERRLHEKSVIFPWILSKLPPPSLKFRQLVPLILNAKVPKNLGKGLPPTLI